MKLDSEIRKDVLAELKWEHDFADSHWDVAVDAGVVTLAGSVLNPLAKWSAELAVKRVWGMTSLISKVKVRTASSELAPWEYRGNPAPGPNGLKRLTTNETEQLMTMTNAASDEEHTSSSAPENLTLVNLNEEHELNYWTERFGVSAAALRVVVHAVGSDVIAVSHAVATGQTEGTGSVSP
jgi:hypothetical protein